MNMLKKILVMLTVLTMPSLAMAQPANPAPAPVTKEVAAPVVAMPAAATPAAPVSDAAPAAAAAPKSMDGSLPGYTPLRPDYENSVGMPKAKEVDLA